MLLIQESLYLHFSAANTMGFLRMHFGPASLAACNANSLDALQLAPSSLTELPLKAHDLANAPADGYRLNILDLTDDLEVHGAFCV
jgi:hypothetical protein